MVKKEKMMSKNSSFDIYSKVDLQEVKNAVEQTQKEMVGRYDFKGSKSTIELNQKDSEMTLLGDDEFKLNALKDILESKLVKRGLSLKALDYQKAEDASGGMRRQKIKIQAGIPQEKAKEIIKVIKDSKIKVQASINDDLVRVSGKSKDELQAIMQIVKEKDFGIFIQFGNYR